MGRDDRNDIRGMVRCSANSPRLVRIFHSNQMRWEEKSKLTESRDREWQKWPVTIVTGAYLGCAAGKVVGKYLVRGNRISFEEKLD